MGITAEQLRLAVHYDPETGIFTRLAYRDGRDRPQTRGVGGETGYVWTDARGRQYRKVCAFGVTDYAHRYAWLYMTGVMPPRVDHENQNSLDNRWANLREATKSQNAANSKLRADSATGLKGVTFSRSRARFVAQIRCNGKGKFLGHFDTAEAAHAAYARAAIEAFGDFASLA